MTNPQQRTAEETLLCKAYMIQCSCMKIEHVFVNLCHRCLPRNRCWLLLVWLQPGLILFFFFLYFSPLCPSLPFLYFPPFLFLVSPHPASLAHTATPSPLHVRHFWPMAVVAEGVEARPLLALSQ